MTSVSALGLRPFGRGSLHIRSEHFSWSEEVVIIRKVAVTAGVAVVALGLGGGIANAAPAAKPIDNPLPLTSVASPQENDRAFAQFGSQVGVAVTVGGLAGTIAGAALGCVFIAPACPAGAVTGAGIGGLVGTIAAGGPTLAYSAWELYEVYNAAPGTTRYADYK